MRVLILGARGVLGREVCTAANNIGHDSYWPDKKTLDITDYYDICKCLRAFQPEVVINCAGLVRNRDYPKSYYISVNGLAPQVLSEDCDLVGSRLIHISTDCVFSGKRGLYTENDAPDPIDIYGISKRAGEIDRNPHLTIRTSFIGFGERGLLAWLLAQRYTAPGYIKSYWNGLTATALSRVIMNVLDKDLYGILHVHSDNVISKYDLLTRLNLYLQLNLDIIETYPPEEHMVNRSLMSIVDTKYYYTVPTINQMLEELSIINNLIAYK